MANPKDRFSRDVAHIIIFVKGHLHALGSGWVLLISDFLPEVQLTILLVLS